MAPEISAVILGYHAGKRLYGFVDKVIKLLDESVPCWEIVLVGNYWRGSDDVTPQIVNDIALKYKNIKAVALPKKGRMGWDARMGLERASGKYICFIDGDEQMPPEDIVRIYKKIKKENLDFVTTYRIKRYDGFTRRLVSGIYNFLFNLLFPRLPVRDVNSKPKIITREAYDHMRLVSNDWFIDAEIVIQVKKLHLKIGEVPTEFYKCSYRKSFVRLDTIFEFLKNLACARFKELLK